jgi:hypothetical protein
MNILGIFSLVVYFQQVACRGNESHTPSVEHGVYGDCPHIYKLFRNDIALARATMRNGGDRILHNEVFELLENHKNQGISSQFLFVGSSITAMGYFTKFTEYLVMEEKRNITVVNRGKGASDITYTLYCIHFSDCTPDVIFADLRFSDWNHDSQSKEALFRKLLSLRRRDGGSPLLVLLNMGREHDNCDFPVETRYSDFAGHYGFTIIDACLAIRHCFGRNKYAKWSAYSSDNIHPTTDLSRAFLAELMKEWWVTSPAMYKQASTLLDHSKKGAKHVLPDLLYPVNAVSPRTLCQTLNDDNADVLKPISSKGFVVKMRVKFGAMGFNNVKRCWQGNSTNDSITFPFFGSRLQVVIYQGPGPRGIMGVHIDGEAKARRNISSFFEGYEWAKGNGRQLIIPICDNLIPKNHTVTFTITSDPANPANPGHECQILALLIS